MLPAGRQQEELSYRELTLTMPIVQQIALTSSFYGKPKNKQTAIKNNEYATQLFCAPSQTDKL